MTATIRAMKKTAAAVDALRRAFEELHLAFSALESENAALRASLKSVTDTVGLRPGRAVRTCEACGKTFTVRLGDLRAGHVAGRFCSRACARPALGKTP